MQNITMTEWKQHEAEVLSAVRGRYPWLVKQYTTAPNAVRLENDIMSSILKLDPDGDAMSPVIRVSGSSTCSGEVGEVGEFARQVCEMRDAMLFVRGVVCRLRVWRDGTCPCGYCSGRGTCERCGGRGVR